MTLVDRYQHRKGGIYDVLGEARIQSDIPLTDMDEVVIYQSLEDGSLWARRKDEFFDGRFKAIARIGVEK